MSIPPVTRAMLMAAGLGTRMRPLTNTIPKPLIPVLEKTLIDRVLDWMRQGGITDATVNVHYLADQIEQHLATRAGGPRIAISDERAELLETGGGLLKALPQMGQGVFASANSDTLCIDGPQPALHRLAAAWDNEKMDALLLLHPAEKAIGYDGAGDFFLHDDGSLRRRGASVGAPYVFTGVQLIHPRLFAGQQPGKFSMNLLYNKGQQEDGTLPRIHGLVHDGDWLHVGDPQGLAQAQDWLLANAA